ncbi:MAG: rhodanese-like domain-containing protein [Rectinemataceae bacterium]|nr:rhodanese-like domain-containing protein [Rectinemataceae bacterium]
MGFFSSISGGNSGNSVEQKIKAGAVVVDVRSVDEYQDEHFPKSLNIPVNELSSRVGEIGPKDKPVVLYCASGSRSAMGTRILKSLGFTDVVNAGGLYDMPGF